MIIAQSMPVGMAWLLRLGYLQLNQISWGLSSKKFDRNLRVILKVLLLSSLKRIPYHLMQEYVIALSYDQIS